VFVFIPTIKESELAEAFKQTLPLIFRHTPIVMAAPAEDFDILQAFVA
jgi:hypothetical protein